MKYSNHYPKLEAQIFPSNTSREELFLFNSNTNRGFSLDGVAADICKKFTGDRKLSEIVTEVEMERKIESGLFNKEIDDLLNELENFKLVSFHENPQSST